MATRKDWFGIFTPFGDEPHYSNYFSLFGRDYEPGTVDSTRNRILIMHDPTQEQILAQADAFERVS